MSTALLVVSGVFALGGMVLLFVSWLGRKPLSDFAALLAASTVFWLAALYFLWLAEITRGCP